MSEKAAIQFFAGKRAASSFIAPKICFGQLATKFGFFELYIAKNSVFPFCLLKYVALTQQSVCPKVVLVPALSHGKKFFSSLQPVTLLLILLQRTFFICDWLSDYGFASFWLRCAVFSIIFVTTFPTAVFLSNSKNTLFSALLRQKKCFCFGYRQIGLFAALNTGNWISFPVFCE